MTWDVRANATLCSRSDLHDNMFTEVDAAVEAV